MLLAPPTAPANVTAPTRWNRFWQNPLANFSYEQTGRIAPDALYGDAWLPAQRTITGDRQVDLAYGGTTLEQAVRTARLVSGATRSFDVDAVDGARMTLAVSPAVAVLLDREAGTYWLATIESSVRLGGEWLAGSHTIDGAAFEGPDAALRGVKVLTTVEDLVAIVGRDAVVAPELLPEA